MTGPLQSQYLLINSPADWNFNSRQRAAEGQIVNRLVWLLIFVLAWPAELFAQSMQDDERQSPPKAETVLSGTPTEVNRPGRAFLKPAALNFSSPGEYGRIIRSCGEKDSQLNLSCEELLRSFNENEAFAKIGDFSNVEDLARYIEEDTALKPCPNRMVRIAMVRGGRVEYFTRELRVGEKCLVDGNHNVFVSSGVCGQWIGEELGTVFTSEVVVRPEEEARKVSLSEQALALAGKASLSESAESEKRSVERPGSSWLARNKNLVIAAASAGVVAGAIAALLGSRSRAEVTVTVR